MLNNSVNKRILRHKKAIENTKTYKQDLFFNILFYSSILIIGLIIQCLWVLNNIENLM